MTLRAERRFAAGAFVTALVALLLTATVSRAQQSVPGHLIVTPPAGADQGAQLGFSVATEGSYTVAGAPLDDRNGTDAGAVKVFDSSTGALRFVIPSPAPVPNGRFGRAVAISGTRIVVGSLFNRAAYVFDLAGTTPTVPVAVLSDPVSTNSDDFGRSVDISGTRVVVGAPTFVSGAGLVYVFDLASATPTEAVLTLSKPGAAAYESFGASVAIEGTRVLVGAPRDSTAELDGGCAFLYDLGSGTPTVPAIVQNPSSSPYNDQFGVAVAISGTRMAVGAHMDSDVWGYGGSVHIYDLAGGAPSRMVSMYNHPWGSSADHFGAAVAISGNLVAIGALHNDRGATDVGVVAIYDLTVAKPPAPQPVVTLYNPTPAAGDFFGCAVALSGSKVVVGAYEDDTGTNSAGSAYLYELAGANPTAPIATLNSPSPATQDSFGFSVAISGTRLVAGAYHDNTGGSNAGSAHVYDLASATPGVPVATLNNPAPAAEDAFGYSVAIAGSLVAVGTPFDDTGAADTGAVYVYDLAGANPAAPIVTINNPSPGTGDLFGCSVAVSGTLILVGANSDNTGATDAGSVYVYDLARATPSVPVLTLNNPAPNATDQFGIAVALSGTRAVVGAYLDDAGATNSGSAYVYDLAGATPTVPIVTLNNPDPAANDFFGRSVAISGSRVVIGAYSDDTPATNAGSAYMYDLMGPSPSVPVAVLNNPAPATTDNFGFSVGISGTRVVVGEYGNDSGATDAGKAWLFDLARTSPTLPLATLNNATPAAGEQFGWAVAIDGGIVAVGTPNDDSPQFDEGSVAIFGDLALEPLTLTAPTANVLGNATVSVAFTLAAPARADTLTLTFAGPTTTVLTLAAAAETSGAHSFSFDARNPTESSQIAGITGGSLIPDGTYTVTLSARDAATDAAIAASARNVVIDTTAPVLSLPGDLTAEAASEAGAVVTFAASASDAGSGLATSSILPESGATFAIGTTIVNATATDKVGNTASGSFNVTVRDTIQPVIASPANITAEAIGGSGAIVSYPPVQVSDAVGVVSITFSHPSGTLFPLGTTPVSVKAKDAAGNEGTGSFSVTVLDRTRPSISGAFSPLILAAGEPLPDYLPQVVTSDTVGGVSVTQNPPAGSETVEGATTVTLTAKDAAGNEASTSFTVDVRARQPASRALISVGDPAPGRGTPSGPPADATLVSLSDPAIDDAGTVVFLAQWGSVAGRGYGIFTLSECLARTGGFAPGAIEATATFKTLGHPVIDSGHVAFLATLGGVAPATEPAVIARPPGGAAAVIARGTGMAEPGGASFKRFKQVAVAGGSVALLAELAPGTGQPKTTAQSDLGLWASDATHPLKLLLREGQRIGAKTIRTLVTLAAGHGSTGQGRGWVVNAGGATQVHALAIFTDGSQALLAAEMDGDVTVLSSTGPNGAGAPELTGASFSSYSFPALNSAGDHTFLGTIKGAANGRGIFLNDPATGTYRAIARTGEPAPPLDGAKYLALQDPVLAADGASLAFAAKLTGIRGLGANTLWWLPAGGSLRLLAQAGQHAPGTPEAQHWQAFTSLAIAPRRGPLFTAALTPGKGGVTAANASGVWATDFTGALRLLFRAGDVIDGKPLKSFAILKALPGATGSTRSFNGAQHVVWLAKFNDGVSAIMQTTVP